MVGDVHSALEGDNITWAGTQQPIPGLTGSLSVCIAPPLITNRWNIRENGEYILRAYIILVHSISLSL